MADPAPPKRGDRARSGLWATLAAAALTGTVLATIFRGPMLSSSILGSAATPGGSLVLWPVAGLVLGCTWWLVAERPRTATALAAGGMSWLLPGFASVTSLPASVRASFLASTPILLLAVHGAVAGWVSSGRPGRPSRYVLWPALGAAVAHLLGYNPFLDVGCDRTCEPSPAPLADLIGPRDALGLTAFLTLLAAAGCVATVVGRAELPRVLRAAAILAPMVIATSALLPWWFWASSTPPMSADALTTLGVAVVMAALLSAEVQVRLVRRKVVRLLDELADGAGFQDGSGLELTTTDRVRMQLSPAVRMALENARLEALGRENLAELQASQRRIVSTTDAERTRIERDLHDGAQQRLVAVALHLRAAGARATPGPAQTLATAASDVRAAVEALRMLAHGTVPAVLHEEGLELAVVELAAHQPVPVDIAVQGTLARIPGPVAVTAYLTVAAALDNVARHSAAARASVRMTVAETVLTVQISDDGNGGAVIGTGLTEVADRVGALGGRLSLDDRNGEGTVLTVMLPCA